MSLPGGIDFGLNRVHVLVTGAAGGIGLEIVQEFLSNAYVTAQYHTSPGSLPELQKGIDNLELFRADVTDEHAVKKLFSRGGEFFEQEVQVLIVNHGIFPEEDVNLVDMDLAQWKRTLDVNLTGPFLLVREFLRRLRKPRRKFAPDLSKVAVVVIGSTSGEFGEAGHVDYSCSKAALQSGFIRTVKNEIVQIAPAGRINAVSPGWVRTPMAEATMSDPSLVDVPLRKIATTSDIARQVLVLASSTFSGHVTGQNIIVAGGMEGRLLNPPGETSAKHEDGSATAAASTSPRAKPRQCHKRLYSMHTSTGSHTPRNEPSQATKVRVCARALSLVLRSKYMGFGDLIMTKAASCHLDISSVHNKIIHVRVLRADT
ncbi:NAD dependent epimerase/dehydratase [Rhizoctonia solani AG-1 IA]|uniref:NAD dependent epimerase/dehydratase n=1 Tax=Thanatephorus cucumeris (strain AG1-IA) TaxID=983506 RepID=L8WMI8_THACA|nr:NAD dependent epimerase/dehydratase [Rhizoctonia solani AG-1 IA]